MDPDRQLMIKVKACQRIRKELDYYKQEVKDNEQQLQEMKDQNKDPYDIKKFDEVLGESRMMVPDSQRRLNTAVQDLKHFMDNLKDQEEQNSGGEWWQAAHEVLAKETDDYETKKEQDGQPSSAKEEPSNIGNPTTNVDDLAKGEVF
ncbi:hypothetical protein ACA910_000268 [Epithemia clementina (nom. ined.)]